MKKQSGITLIALIITIIVMLILVAVTINVALNGGLFDRASKASKDTQIEADKEHLLSAVVYASNYSTGRVDGELLAQDLGTSWQVTGEGPYTVTSPKGNVFTVETNGKIVAAGASETPQTYMDTIAGLDEKVTVIAYSKLEDLNDTNSQNTYLQNLGTNLKAAADSGKVSAVLKETISGIENIAVIPTGFTVSTDDSEDAISEGLVLTNGANEFVWMPYVDTALYVEDSFGPLTGTDSTSNAVYDSQEQLDYYYGAGYYNYSQDFTYAQDKTNIENSINKYRGFIVGRYETTITSTGTIGSMPNEDVLRVNKKIAQTNNERVRWYGLYKVQKDLYAGNTSVFSSMITSKEWDKIMTFTGYGSIIRDNDTTYTTIPDKSGSSYADDSTQYDVSKNIYDLAGNLYEWTLNIAYDSDRIYRGGFFGNSFSASYISYSRPDDYEWGAVR